MNRHTFKDVVKSKRSSLANELDDDEDDEREVAPLRRDVEGEEEEGEEKFNDAGEVLEAFNLRDERDGGHFDENMNYVFKKEKGEVDAWVAGMDEQAMEQAIGEAARAMKRKAAQREKEEEQEAQKEYVPSIRLKQQLLTFMKPKETVSGAMRRLSGKNDANAKADGVVRRRAPPTADNGNNSQQPVQTSLQKQKEKLQQQRDARAQQANISRLTELADELLSRGLTGVYSMTFEALLASTLMWEYKGLTDGQVHGPFMAQQLAGWKAQGFFTGPTAVQVRAIGENHASDMQASSSNSGSTSTAATADPAAAAALRAFGISKAAADSDNIYDDEDLPTTTAATGAAPTAVVTVPPTWADWLSSDAVEFGEYINLDQAREVQRQPLSQRGKQARTTVHTYDRDSAPSAAAAAAGGGRAGGSVLSGAGAGASASGRAGAAGEEDSGDEDEVEEAEGMRYRRAKAGSRKTRDVPDSDEDE